jgi:3-oxoacyl-[acyl-carrier-protein] synthase I
LRSWWRNGNCFGRICSGLRESAHAEQGRGALPLGSDAVAKVMASGVSAIVGKILGLGAQVTSNSSACTTGTEAIFEGYKNILLGYADSMYVGGTEGTHVGIYAGFDAMRDVLCSDYNDLPEKLRNRWELVRVDCASLFPHIATPAVKEMVVR